VRSTGIVAVFLGLALCAAPLSIAITESLLVCAFVIQLALAVRQRVSVRVPRLFRYWLPWAILEIAAWLHSPELKAGWGEMRHLWLLVVLWLTIPALRISSQAVAVWRGIFLTATLNSIVLVITVATRLARYRHVQPPVELDVFVRNGGLLHHWMIYATLEILVFAAMLEFWRSYPSGRRWLLPMLAVNSLAILLSLTRMLWLSCLVVLIASLAWRRSRWLFAMPVLLIAILLVAPAVVRSRITESIQPDYYSNAERVQMLRVGWEMIRQHPFSGVGPGRVETLYRSYLKPSDPVPAYYGHLHNNLVQLGAEFGLPALAAALFFLAMLVRELIKQYRSPQTAEMQFLCRAAILGLAGYLIAGMFEYTYGHSLGLIMLGFAVLAPISITPTRSCPAVCE